MVGDDDSWDAERNKALWKNHRNTFLRKHHRAPLKERIKDVLGPYADEAFGLVSALPKTVQRGSWTRSKLRAVKQSIPEDDYSRRWKYFQGCLGQIEDKTEAVLWEAADEAERILEVMDDDDYRNIDPLELKALYATIVKAERYSKQYGWLDLKACLGPKHERLAAELWKLSCTKFDPAGEAGLRWLFRVSTGACKAKNPVRYVRVVIQNAKKKKLRRPQRSRSPTRD